MRAESPSSFRVSTVIPMAIEPVETATSGAPPFLTLGRRLSGQARLQVEKLSNRSETHLKEALSLTLDAMEAIEREVEMLHRRMLLTHRDLELVDTELELGADGAFLPATTPPETGVARLHLLLNVRNARHLVSIEADAEPRDGGCEFTFSTADPDVRDLVVAFAFEHQRRERRRELDAPVVD
jgi:hypothetical protein